MKFGLAQVVMKHNMKKTLLLNFNQNIYINEANQRQSSC